MVGRPASTIVGLTAAALLTSGCASPLPKRIYTAAEMNTELHSRVSAQMRDQVVIPFEIDDEIRALAHDVTRNAEDERAKIGALVEAIIGLSQFSISYDWLSNKTAKEVFRQGKGNCLAYTNLFIGMAREVGIDAVYVDVTSVERHTREAEVLVNNGHVTAGIIQGPDVMVIDFTKTPEREYLGYQIIDDLEGIAHYYNNQGFLYGFFTETTGRDTSFDPMTKELEMYRMALQVKPTFLRAKNNLGVALRRRGRITEAIAQYKEAIAIDPKFADARANLAAAYYMQGRVSEAVAELEVASRDSSNGYFHHHLGIVQFELKRYQEAIKEFRKALSMEPGLAMARYYLGESYKQLGDTRRAIEEYTEALALDPNLEPARLNMDRLAAQTAAREN